MISKQKRSNDRVDKIISTAKLILEHGEVADITIARISEMSNLKRTSTYKFFPTPDHIKSYLQNEFIIDSLLFINSNIQKPESDELHNILNELVTSLINYFNESSPAKKLILDSSVFGAQINSLSILSESINKFVSSNIELPSMFNEKGVFLVLTQIIISVLSLNYKMDRELNDIGKNEAVRASLSYLIACTAKQ